MTLEMNSKIRRVEFFDSGNSATVPYENRNLVIPGTKSWVLDVLNSGSRIQDPGIATLKLLGAGNRYPEI